jgi:probable O-glycosylation ligase (exosortase A-associated)
MAFLTPVMITNEARLRHLVWVVVVSLGFYAAKGGFLNLLTGGSYQIHGPPESFLEDNNAFALASLMMLPFICYLQSVTRARWGRIALSGLFLLCVAGIAFTYSRGGFLGLSVVLFCLWLRAKRRALIAGGAVVMLLVALPLVPERLYDRFESISDYQEDASAQGRLGMWQMGWNIALDRPITGGGFRVYKNADVYPTYYPDAPMVLDVHNIYLEVLGEHGFVGLALFLALAIATVRSSGWVRRRTKDRADLKWAYDLAAALRISMLGYAVSGTFLTMAFFDLYYLIIALTVGLRVVVTNSLAGKPVSASESAPGVPTIVGGRIVRAPGAN